MRDKLFSRFEWYRRFTGGIWYKNRYWWDFGRSMAVVWERKYLGAQGGRRCTLEVHHYQ